MTRSRKTLKKRLFKRDGWQIIDPYAGEIMWVAWCAFGCGTLLTVNNATIDHYPIPRRLGGSATLSNTRLACFPCNTRDGGPAGAATKVVPQGLTPLQRRRWWQENHHLLDCVTPARDGQDEHRAEHRTSV